MKFPIVTLIAVLALLPATEGSMQPLPDVVVVYQPEFIGGNLRLLPVSCKIEHAQQLGGQAEAALRVLVKSPHFREHFSSDVCLRSVSIAGNILVVDFDVTISTLNAGSWREYVLIQSIVHTGLAAEPEATGLRVLVGGETAASIGGHVYTGEPLTADPAVVWAGPANCHDHWAAVPVSLLILRDIIPTYREDLFGPEQMLTRAEFIEMVHRAAPPFLQAVPGSGNAYPSRFTDIEDADLDYMVQSMIAAGILDPSHYGEPTMLHPQQPISRREAATIALAIADPGVVRGLRSAGAPMDLYVRSAMHMGLIQGYPDASLRLNAPTSRAEGAVLLARAIGLDPTGNATAVALPRPGATLRRGEPVVGMAASAGHSTLEYRLQMHECLTVVSEGQVRTYQGGWFSFAPHITGEWRTGPAYLAVEGAGRVPVLLK